MATNNLRLMDMHVHTAGSDGQASLGEAVELAAGAGMSALAVTDHLDPYARLYEETPGRSNDEAGLARQIRLRDANASSTPIAVFIGIERGPIPVPLTNVRPDLVIASVHYITKSPPVPVRRGQLFNEAYWQAYMAEAIRIVEGPQVDIVGHISGYLPMGPMLTPGSTFDERREMERAVAARYFTLDWYERVFRTAHDRGIAIEIHCPTRSPSPDIVALGVGMGVKFTVGSDAHISSWIGDVDWGYELLESMGASPDNVWSPACTGRVCGGKS